MHRLAAHGRSGRLGSAALASPPKLARSQLYEPNITVQSSVCDGHSGSLSRPAAPVNWGPDYRASLGCLRHRVDPDSPVHVGALW